MTATEGRTVRRRLRAAWDFTYWNLQYTIGFSFTAGVTNGLGAHADGGQFNCGMGEAIRNHFPAGLVMTSGYPIAHRLLQNTRYYRSGAHLFNIATGALLIGWHYYAGTENPVLTMLPNITVGAVMTNQHVNTTLEQRMQESE